MYFFLPLSKRKKLLTCCLCHQDDHLIFRFLRSLLQPRWVLNFLLCGNSWLLLSSTSSLASHHLLLTQGAPSLCTCPTSGTRPPWASAGPAEPLRSRSSPGLSPDVPALSTGGGRPGGTSSTASSPTVNLTVMATAAVEVVCDQHCQRTECLQSQCL